MTSFLVWYAVVTAVLLATLSTVVVGQWCAPRVRPALRLLSRALPVPVAAGS